MNNPIKLTEKAIKKIRELTDKSDKFALRLDLKKGWLCRYGILYGIR